VFQFGLHVRTSESIPNQINEVTALANQAYNQAISTSEATTSGLASLNTALSEHASENEASFADIASGYYDSSEVDGLFSSFAPSWSSITGKPSFFTPDEGSHISDSVTNAATDAATNGPTDAPTDARTDYGALAAILGAEANVNNAKQNSTAANVNTLAGIVNANATKQNAGFVILNALAGKFNLSLDILESNGLMSA